MLKKVLDLRVYPDGGYKILDTNEYNYHKKKMKYPDTIDKIVKKKGILNDRRNKKRFSIIRK